jgi:hypothetical protein
MKKGKASKQRFVSKISEFIFEKQQRCKDGSKVPPLEVQCQLSIATIQDGKVIRSGGTELFMGSNENDLKRWVDTTISEDICSHE